MSTSGGKVDRLRLGLGGATPVPQALHALGQAACGRRPDDDWVRDVARGAAEQLVVEEDRRVSVQFRRELTTTVVGRALRHALAQLKA